MLFSFLKITNHNQSLITDCAAIPSGRRWALVRVAIRGNFAIHNWTINICAAAAWVTFIVSGWAITAGRRGIVGRLRFNQFAVVWLQVGIGVFGTLHADSIGSKHFILGTKRAHVVLHVLTFFAYSWNLAVGFGQADIDIVGGEGHISAILANSELEHLVKSAVLAFVALHIISCGVDSSELATRGI